MKGIFEAAAVSHKLPVLAVPDGICLERLRARNAEGAHEYTVSPAEFEELGRHFEPPTPADGFDVVVQPWR